MDIPASTETNVEVNVDVIDVDSKEKQEGQRGFMQLRQSDRSAEPEEVVACYVGGLPLSDVHKLFDHLLQEIQRQLKPNQQGRIKYRFMGGDDKRGETHNCLTWLRYMMKDFTNKDFGIPRSAVRLIFWWPI